MSMGWQDQAWSKDLWYSGKVARRRFLGLGAAAAGAIGASMLVLAPWHGAFGQARSYRIGSLQSLTGVAASAGRASLIGTELAVRRINASHGINGRPVELIVEDDQSRADTGNGRPRSSPPRIRSTPTRADFSRTSVWRAWGSGSNTGSST